MQWLLEEDQPERLNRLHHGDGSVDRPEILRVRPVAHVGVHHDSDVVPEIITKKGELFDFEIGGFGGANRLTLLAVFQIKTGADLGRDESL